MIFSVGKIRYEVRHELDTTSDHEVMIIKRLQRAPEGDIVIPYRVTHDNITYTVTAIGFEAFENCIDVTSVTIPNSVSSIRDFAFYDCKNLFSLTITNPNTYLSVCPFIGTPFGSVYNKLKREDFVKFLNEKDKFKYVENGFLNLEDIEFLLDKTEYTGFMNGNEYGI